VKEQTVNNRSGNLSKELNERMVANQHEIEINLVAQVIKAGSSITSKPRSHYW